jgi:hypothetical protein
MEAEEGGEKGRKSQGKELGVMMGGMNVVLLYCISA